MCIIVKFYCALQILTITQFLKYIYFLQDYIIIEVSKHIDNKMLVSDFLLFFQMNVQYEHMAM